MDHRLIMRTGAIAIAAVTLFACGGGSGAEEGSPAATEGSEVMPDEYGQSVEQSQQAAPGEPAPQRTARAEFQTAPGVELQGSAEFTSTANGVLARVKIEKAKPGKHGIHVHEKGDCSDIPGKSMGSHFAPDAHEHGLPGTPARHLGDLGNIDVGEDGTGQHEIEIATATLDDGPRTFAGKALVIHEKEDVGTGASGDSGPPIACAIIEAQ